MRGKLQCTVYTNGHTRNTYLLLHTPDDEDIEREIKNMFIRTNMLICKFKKCSVAVKTTLFKSLGRPEPRSGRAYVLPVMFYFFLFRHVFSETPRPIALKLCHMIRIWRYFIN